MLTRFPKRALRTHHAVLMVREEQNLHRLAEVCQQRQSRLRAWLVEGGKQVVDVKRRSKLV